MKENRLKLFWNFQRFVKKYFDKPIIKTTTTLPNHPLNLHLFIINKTIEGGKL